jgi:hypothetical protein
MHLQNFIGVSVDLGFNALDVEPESVPGCSPMRKGLAFRSRWVEPMRIVEGLLCVALAIAPAVPVLHAQQTSPGTPDAQTPEKAFITNGGGDFGLNPKNVVEGAVAERAYNEFFAGMKNWGRYEIVANPARADWVFEISVNNRQTCVETRSRWLTQDDYSVKLAMSKTNDWRAEKTFVERFKPAGLLASPDKIFDGAIAALVDDVKGTLGEPASYTSLAHPDDPMAPVPPRIGMAAKIFILNRGASDPDQEKYSGGAAHVDDQFSAALKNWGRYAIVPAVKEADLVFEISFAVEPACGNLGDPQFTLVIQDAKTQVRLWSMTSHVGAAFLAGNARKNFARGMIDLVAQVRELSERPTWVTDASTSAAPRPAVPGTVGTQASTAAPIPVTISTPGTAVKSGSNIRVGVTLRNASKQDYDFTYATGDPLTCMIAVRDAQGNMAADTAQGRKTKDMHATWRGQPLTYSLQPGETQTRDCAVSELYDMTHPGKYSIEVQQLDGRPVKSNTEVVTVVP